MMMNCLLLQSNHAVLLQPETFILVLPLSCYTHKQKCRRGAPPKKNAKHLRLGVLGSPCIDPLLKYLGQNISCVMTCHEVSIGKVQQYLVFVYDVCIYIYGIVVCYLVDFSNSIINPRIGRYGAPDWELRDAQYQCFWLRFLVRDVYV